MRSERRWTSAFRERLSVLRQHRTRRLCLPSSAKVSAEQVAVGIDARKGLVAVRGWVETSTTRVEELARRVLEAGIRTLIYTDIDRDGMLNGPDIAGAVSLRAGGGNVIVSGGVSGSDDVRDGVSSGT